MTYQRDGNVLIGQSVFPPGIICQVQDSSVSLNFAVHHRRKPQIKECTSDILTNISVALWLSDNTVLESLGDKTIRSARLRQAR